jgi:hypothetical protein
MALNICSSVSGGLPASGYTQLWTMPFMSKYRLSAQAHVH